MLKRLLPYILNSSRRKPTPQLGAKVGDGIFTNTFKIEADNEFILVVPIGSFPNHHDGAHVIEDKHISEMAENIKNGGTDILYDYGHESIWYSAAKAAGWSPNGEADVRAVPGRGLEVRFPTFTENAQQAIDQGEYRYFSPAYLLNAQDNLGRDIGAILHSVALVNKPNMAKEIDHIDTRKTNSEMSMYSEAFLNSLGLTKEATPQEIEAAVTAKLNTENTPETDDSGKGSPSPNQPPSPSSEAGGEENSDLADRVASLEARVAADAEAAVLNSATALVDSAIAAQKILPAQRQVWLNSAKADYEATKKMLDEIKANAAAPGNLNVQTGGGDDVTKNSMTAATDFIRSQRAAS